MTPARWTALSVCAATFAVAGGAHAECVETGPAGAERPQLVDAFPSRGTSGYAATLHVVVSHGNGETVLPHGLELQTTSDTARALKEAGFALPDQTGEARARVATSDADPKTGRRQTVVDLPLVALPANPGRHTLVLPALPISIARASSDVITVCTKPHTLVVEDPTASTPSAVPQPNPAPRAQREEWTSLKRALAWGAVGVVAGGVLAWLFYRWTKRPKPVVPPPPPRPPWEIALQRLDEVRHAGLLETKRFAEFFDRLNDAVRECLGARYGFDGLESTTDETIEALRRVSQLGVPLPEVVAFLQECDLVKFADVTPSTEACTQALGDAERVVRATMPAATHAAEGARP
ncbi:MAG TPA: hypothetical protein VGM06_02355 [Polyangiaceae bacterium]|jgi:hypothetical protein